MKKNLARKIRQKRVRARISGTEDRPRLSVFKSALHISAQIINDETGKTLASASDTQLSKTEIAALRKGEGERRAKVAIAFAVGKLVAEKAKAVGVHTVVFDRAGFTYAGRIAALATGARESGLKF